MHELMRESKGMTDYVYFCPKCGRPHSREEYSESRFCRHCGKFLTSRDKRVLEQGSTKKEEVLKLDDVENSIEKTYELIQQNIPHNARLDSLEVVKQVEKYRQFWKPEKVNVVLLAESHVYTEREEFDTTCRNSILDRIMLPQNKGYPVNFVRFVYCLGYGENDLLTEKIKKNQGTWQFWKIFSRCIGEDEAEVLKYGTPNFERRLRNKVQVLRKMQDRGIWLLDASIVGLYKSGIKKDKEIFNGIMSESWLSYVQKVTSDVHPKHIVVIGKAVEKIVSYSLRKLNFDYTAIDAPQAQLSAEMQEANYEKYREICGKYC